MIYKKMETIIYYLFNKSEGKPIYVGQTTKSIHMRLLGHKSHAHRGHRAYIYHYMRNIGIDNIDIKEIITCSPEKANEYETTAMEILHPICNTKRCCLSSYATKAEYKKAWREKNIQMEKYKCPVCNKCSGDGHRLKVHLKSHYL